MDTGALTKRINTNNDVTLLHIARACHTHCSGAIGDGIRACVKEMGGARHVDFDPEASGADLGTGGTLTSAATVNLRAQ